MGRISGRGPAPDAVGAGASRRRILELLRDSGQPLGVQELADRVALHANTVRFHLDRLVTEELVQRHVQERTEPGRPRLAFTASSRPDDGVGGAPGQRSYRLLAEILAGFVSEAVPDAASAAKEAGRTWGRYLTERPVPYRRATEDESVSELLRTLGEIGFAPELPAETNGQQIWLRRCPFLEVAKTHRDVVCSVHLGLMQGALAEMRAPVSADRLEPFVEPSLCIAHLSAVSRGHPNE